MANPVDLTVGAPPTPEVDTESGAPAFDDFDDVTQVLEAPHVDETLVRTFLNAFGTGANYGIGNKNVPEHWQFTDRELNDLTPPLTRIINRRPALRAAVARGDEMAVGIVLAGYTGRNMAAGRAATIQEKKDNVRLEAEADKSGRSVGAPGARTDSGQVADGQSGGGVYPAPGGAMG